MNKEAQRLKDLGYDFALKGWHDNKPVEGFMLIVWKPGDARNTSITQNGEHPTLLFAKVLEIIENRGF